MATARTGAGGKQAVDRPQDAHQGRPYDGRGLITVYIDLGTSTIQWSIYAKMFDLL